MGQNINESISISCTFVIKEQTCMHIAQNTFMYIVGIWYMPDEMNMFHIIVQIHILFVCSSYHIYNIYAYI